MEKKSIAEQFDEKMGNTYKAPLQSAELMVKRLKRELTDSLTPEQTSIFAEYETAMERLILIIAGESFSRGMFTASMLN